MAMELCRTAGNRPGSRIEGRLDALKTPTHELEEWARHIAQWRSRADVLVYFENDWEGVAVGNARAQAAFSRTSRG